MSKINEGVFRDIRRILRNLKKSTDIKYVFKNESVTISRRCSPYASHEGMSFGPGHGIGKVIYIANKRFAILVTRGERYSVDGNPTDEIRLEYIPAFLIRGILPDWNQPDWLDLPLVSIYYANRFAGFTEDGKPIYRDEVEKAIEDGRETFRIYAFRNPKLVIG